jgi:hypothetical protein
MDPEVTYKMGRWVTSESTDYIILFFAFNTNYVEQGIKKLEKQCPGRIAQVTTEHVTSYKFLSYQQKVVFKGLCT